MSNPRIFRHFKTSPEIIRLAVMLYVRYPLSPRNVEDHLHERGIAITALHGQVDNHFNQERTLISRAIFKERRTAAFSEWRQLCAT